MRWGHYVGRMLSEVLRAVLPICVLLLALKAILGGIQSHSVRGFVEGMRGTGRILVGIGAVVVGLSLFLKGLEFSLLPLGENVGTTLPRRAHLPLMGLFSLLLGALAALAEPDLRVYVEKVVELLGGRVDSTVLRVLSAAGTAVGFTVGILRIVFRWRFAVVFVPAMVLACGLTLFCPKPLSLAAWDVSPVISGAVTVPLFLALGVGLASVVGGENAGMAGFGLVTLASLGPVVAFLLYGVLCARGEPLVSVEWVGPGNSENSLSGVGNVLEVGGEVLGVIAPVYVFLMFFQRVILRSPIRHATTVWVGVGVIVGGLVLFFEGLEVGFFPLAKGVGELLPSVVPKGGVVVGVCVVLGLVCTFAEPSVMVFTRQIEEATAGALPRHFLLGALGVGVAFGFGVGILRIWLNVSLPYVLLPLLGLGSLLTWTTRDRYAMIAWDSMGVASGSVTVPFFLSVGLGVASAVSSEASSMGLGLVTMASVGPVLSVLWIGVILRGDRR